MKSFNSTPFKSWTIFYLGTYQWTFLRCNSFQESWIMATATRLLFQIYVISCTISGLWNPFIHVCNLQNANKQYKCSILCQRTNLNKSISHYYCIQGTFYCNLRKPFFQGASNNFKDKTPCFLLGFPIQNQPFNLTFQFTQLNVPSPVHIVTRNENGLRSFKITFEIFKYLNSRRKYWMKSILN